MKITPFKLERYFAKYEFAAKYLLSSSDCDGFSLAEILSLADSEELKLWQNLKLGYTESQGLPLLREEISKLYTIINSDQVLVLTPEEGIFIALNCILNGDDHVVCIYPCYQSLHQIVESIGCQVTYWKPNEASNWYYDPNDLEKAIKSNTKLIIVNFPHNPTGYLPKLTDFERIVSIARDKKIMLFSDEMYRFLEHSSSMNLPSASDMYSSTVSLFGLSKTFGLAGLRLGWLTTQNKSLMNQMMAFKDYTTICSSAPSEILGLIALRHRDFLIDINLKKIRKNLTILDNFIAKHNSLLSWSKPTAGTIGFAKLNSKLTSLEFCEKLVKEKSVMAVPGEVFDYPNHIRFGYGRSNFPESLDLLDEFIISNGF